MRIVLLLCLALFCFRLSAQSTYDTSRMTVIQLDTLENWSHHLAGATPAMLNPGQIHLADSILKACIAQNNNNGVRSPTIGIYIGIHEFLIQLVPAVNQKGELVVWANCFCMKHKMRSPELDWKNKLVLVKDGGVGGCFFNVLLNLNKKDYSDVYVNGI